MNWLTSRIAPVAALAGLLTLVGCEKDTDQTVDLPDTTPISTQYEEFGVEASTVLLSPVNSLKTDHFLVGRLRDELAGITQANAYLNVAAVGLRDSLPSRNTRMLLDSVVLVMGFNTVYGSSAVPAQFDLFQLQQPLDDRTVYHSASSEVLNTTPLGLNLVSRLNRTQRVVVPAVGTTPASSTTIPDATVRLLVQRTATPTTPAVVSPVFQSLYTELNTATTLTQDRLNTFLKGIALKPAAGYNQAIVSFPRTSNARLQVYFHKDTTAASVRQKWHSYSIGFGSVSGGNSVASDPRYYTQIISDFTSAQPAVLAALAGAGTPAVPATALGGVSYVQEGVGLGTRISLTALDGLRSRKGLAINRAELRIPIKPYSNGLLPYPVGLYAVEAGADNQVLQHIVNFTQVDRVVQADGQNPRGSGNDAFSGALVNATSSQPYYSLPITNYLQAYLNNNLNGERPASLILVPNIRRSTSLKLNRAKLDAANIRFYVYYSKL